MTRVCMAMALLAAVVGALLLPGRVAEADAGSRDYFAVDIRAHDFNMCDAKCSALPGNAAALVLWNNNMSNGFGAPWAISLNEICGESLTYLNSVLTSKTPRFTKTKEPTTCPGTDDRFGNAVYTSGTRLSSNEYQFGNQEVSDCQVGPNRECRRMVCAQFSSYAGTLSQCSSHLDNDDVDLAYDQAAEYIYVANAWYSNGRFLSGDLNLEPGEVPGVFVSQYYRSPLMWTHDSTTPDEQLDYVWHDKAHSSFNTTGNRACEPDYSDHCYVFARFG